MSLSRVRDWSFPQDLDSSKKIEDFLRVWYDELKLESIDRVEDFGSLGISGLTTGSVLFAGGSGTITQDNDDFFWDATNIRLGLNVGTSPSVTLDVSGDTSLDGAVTVNTSAAAKDFLAKGDTDASLFLVDASADRVGVSCTPSTTFEISGTFKSAGGAINLDEAVTINDSAADKDFLVKGDTDTGLFLVDASTDRVGISCVPSTTFENSGTFKSSGGAISLDNAVTINNSEADVDFRVAGDTATHLLFADASTNRFGVNEDAPVCLAHFRTATCADYAGVSPDTVLLLENSSNVAIQLQGATNASAYINFCDDAYNAPNGRIAYDFANDQLEFIAGGNEIGQLTNTQFTLSIATIHLDSIGASRFIADAHNADAYAEFQEDATLKWTAGYDYSDGKYKISEGAPGTNSRMEIISSGSMNVYDSGAAHLQIYAESSGTARLIARSHTGDAYVELKEQAVSKWCAGFDYTDSNAYVISEGAPGTNNRFKIASGGAITAGGTLGIGTITVIDGSSINLQEDITFTGATTENLIKMPDNLADALSIQEGSNKYVTFDTIDDEEDVFLYKSVDILHTSTHADDHALEIDTDAAGYGDVKALDIDYVTGNITAGEDEGILLINVDRTLATGGDIFALEVLATDQVTGSTGTYGLKIGAEIGPVHQDSGTFANPTKGTDNTIGSSVTDTSIGFTQSPDTITDSNNGFGGFVVDELVVVTGATTGANNTTYTITAVAASALTVTPQPNTVEDDGATITVEGNVPAMLDGSLGTTTAIFEANSEYILIGAAAAFEEIEFIVDTSASGAGIKPTFWYSTAGSHQFTQFTPVDGTDGFKHTGVVAWDTSDLSSHAANTDTSTYDIKVIRTRSNLTTSPILGYAKTAATTEYIWDKDGDVNIRNLTTTGQFNISTTNQDGIVFGSLGTATKGIDFSSSGLSGFGDSWIYFDANNFIDAVGNLRLNGITVASSFTTPVLEAPVNMDIEIRTASGYGNFIFWSRSLSENSVLMGDRRPESITNCTSNGTTTITKTSHEKTVNAGDMLHIIDATTSADKGYYRVVSTTASTFVVDRALGGSDSDVDLKIYNDVLGFFYTDGTNGQRIMGYSAQDKPLQLGGDALTATANLGSEDILMGNLMGLTNTSDPGGACTNGTILYAKDSSDGAANSTLAIYTEQAVEVIGTFTPSHKHKIWINGVEYWIQLDAV